MNAVLSYNAPRSVSGVGNYALSIRCNWLGFRHGKNLTFDRLWWQTKPGVRVYFVPVERNGVINLSVPTFRISWMHQSKLPAQNIMVDPPKYGYYDQRYMFIKIQVRESPGKYCLIDGVLNLWHWHRIYPDPLDWNQTEALKKKHRVLLFQNQETRNQLLYVLFPPGQTSRDPMVIYIQLPAIPTVVLNQVKEALGELIMVPSNFKVPSNKAKVGLSNTKTSPIQGGETYYDFKYP